MLLVSDTTDAVFRRTIHDVFSDMEWLELYVGFPRKVSQLARQVPDA